jgi:hypothetical protein
VSTWDVGWVIVTHIDHLEREEQGAGRHALEVVEEDTTVKDEVDAWGCSDGRQQQSMVVDASILATAGGRSWRYLVGGLSGVAKRREARE